jgi:hypothetical protein
MDNKLGEDEILQALELVESYKLFRTSRIQERSC